MKAFMYDAVGSFLHYQILRTHIQSCCKKEYIRVNKLGIIHKIHLSLLYEVPAL